MLKIRFTEEQVIGILKLTCTFFHPRFIWLKCAESYEQQHAALENKKGRAPPSQDAFVLNRLRTVSATHFCWAEMTR